MGAIDRLIVRPGLGTARPAPPQPGSSRERRKRSKAEQLVSIIEELVSIIMVGFQRETPDMPSSASEGSGPAEADARVPPGKRAMGFLKWLDGFLSEELRQAPPEELGRARVMAGAALCLILVSGPASVAFLVTGMPWSYAVGTCSAAVGYVGTLWILRRASSARPAALLLCGIMSSGFSLTAFSANDPFLPAHAAVMLITILTVYLLGPRLGLVVLIPVVLFVGIGFPLWRQNFGSELRAPPWL